MNDLQFSVFCSYILSLILLFHSWRRIVISCVRGRVELDFYLSLSLMKRPISGVKLGVLVFPVASWDVCIVRVGDDGVEVCFVVIGMKLKARNCCSV